MKIRVAVAQMDCELGNKNRNLERIARISAGLSRRKPDIVCFPELAVTGYSLNEMWRDVAEPVPGPSTDKLSEICSKYGFYLIAGLVELDRNKERIYDSAVILDRRGELVGTYRKVHLWAKERDHFTAGEDFPVFETEFGKIGVGICYDTEFPEPARALAIQGAKLVFFPSAEMKPMEEHLDTYVRSRAAENCIFTAFSNRIGREGKTVFFGRSQIVSPDCRVLARAGTGENHAVATLDTSFLEKERELLPYIEQRVVGAYSVLN